MKILVTGATGGYGSRALAYLKAHQTPDLELYGLARNPAKAKALAAQGIKIRLGDYSDPASLQAAFRDIDRLLFVSVSVPELQQNVVKAIAASPIQYVAYTSLYGLNYPKFGLEANHRQTEQWLRETDVRSTFLRDNFYLDMMAPEFAAALKTGQFTYFSGDGRVAWALKREYAEVGARAMLAGDFPQVVNLAGQPVSYRDLGAAVATLGAVTVTAGSQAATVASLQAGGLTPGQIGLITGYQNYARTGQNGEADATTSDFEHYLGHPLTSLPAAIKALLATK